MKVIRINKETKFRLNKRTIAHLDSRQMAHVGGGVDDAGEEQSVAKCNTYPIEHTMESERICPTYITHDTGIPPYGKKNRST